MSNRIFYASHSVSVSGVVVQGATSVSLATNFSLEKMYQLGHISVYDQIVNAPEVEVTIAKALDGYPTIFSMCGGATTLVGSSNQSPTLILAIGNDTDAQVGASEGGASIQMTGCFLKSVKYDMQVEGAFTEECSFVGGSKTIESAGGAPASSGAKVLNRRNFSMSGSTLPAEVTGKNLQSVSISADLGREAMYKLGQYTPFFRSIQFPLEITCEIAVIATTHDGVEIETATNEGCVAVANSVPSGQQITISLCSATGAGLEKYKFDLGNQCTLQSVNYSGGDTGGGNVTITYSYTTANTLTITG